MRDLKKMPSSTIESAPSALGNAPEVSNSAPANGHSFAQTSVLGSAPPVQALKIGAHREQPDGGYQNDPDAGYNNGAWQGAEPSGGYQNEEVLPESGGYNNKIGIGNHRK